MSSSASGRAMARHAIDVDVLGPWSLTMSRRFWEGFTPAALSSQDEAADARDEAQAIRTVFLSEHDWSRVDARVTQHGTLARITVTGEGDLDAAAAQVARFLSLDVDARVWPDIGARDPVIGEAQQELPGLRPCGFHSPYEAAAWAVLSQRLRIVQAARLRADLVERYGDGGAFPTPAVLRDLGLDLPGRKSEYLRAVADAALDGTLDGVRLRSLDPDDAVREVRTTPSGRSGRSKDSARSPRSWSSFAAPTRLTRCHTTNAG